MEQNASSIHKSNLLHQISVSLLPVFQYPMWKNSSILDQAVLNRSPRGEKYTDTTYLLRVELVKGEGMVNNCQAAITVQQTSLDHASIMWWTTPFSYRISISSARPEYLELFKLRQYDCDAKPKHFVFYSGMRERDQMQPYDKVENVLSVTLGSSNGNLPKPYVKTICCFGNSCQSMPLII